MFLSMYSDFSSYMTSDELHAKEIDNVSRRIFKRCSSNIQKPKFERDILLVVTVDVYTHTHIGPRLGFCAGNIHHGDSKQNVLI